MEIIVAAVGRAKSGPEREICDAYAGRLATPVKLKEVEERRRLPAAERMASEGKKLLDALPAKGFVVVLDRTGRVLSSDGLARKVGQWMEAGHSSLSFVIGGADGLDGAVLDRADFKLSLGALTLPHLLARAVLMEQLYRAQCIRTGHPYHK